MKKALLSITCLILISFLNVLSYGQAEWYTIFEGEQYVTDFTLKAHSSKTVVIESEKTISVGYRVNMYPGLSEKYGYNYPVCFTHPETSSSMCTFYADMKIEPVDGKIEIVFDNEADEDFQVVVYIKP